MSDKKGLSDIVSFEIKIGDSQFKNNLREDLNIDRTNLDEEFMTQHEKFAYYSTLHEMAKHNENQCKRELEILYAQVDFEVRQQAQEAGIKMTETMIKNQAITDERYQKKHLEYLESKKLAGILGVARESFSQRKEMLISIGANARTGSSSMRVLEDKAKETIAKKSDRRRKPRR